MNSKKSIVRYIEVFLDVMVMFTSYLIANRIKFGFFRTGLINRTEHYLTLFLLEFTVYVVVYFVAFRNDIDATSFEFPSPTTPNPPALSSIEEKEPVPAKYYISDVYLETLRRHRAHHEALGHGFGFEIRDWNSVAGAIVCGGMGRERNLVVDFRQKDLTPTTHIKGTINKEGIRKLTPREWARLQGFPDDFKLPLADVHMYKQFGNSVTVNVIESIAKKIKEVLDFNLSRKTIH